jgi:hypothetical protein
LIVNRGRNRPRLLEDTGGTCALCETQCPGGPQGVRMVRIAWAAYSGVEEDPERRGVDLVVTLCPRCAADLQSALRLLHLEASAGEKASTGEL